jgi:hypothetical protein
LSGPSVTADWKKRRFGLFWSNGLRGPYFLTRLAAAYLELDLQDWDVDWEREEWKLIHIFLTGGLFIFFFIGWLVLAKQEKATK